MHGLIFATWEKFLGEQYGEVILGVYRAAIEGTEASIPVASRSYDDALLYKGVTAVSKMTGLEPSAFLRDYGRYFITNGLTTHICKNILTNIHSARELLLAMRAIHKQLNYASSEIVPPFFSYIPLANEAIRVTYESHRHLCPLLCGAIEGAGMLYGEEIAMRELSCMQKGDSDCQFDVLFMGKCEMSPIGNKRTEQQGIKNNRMAEMIFHMLPADGKGITLLEISMLLRYHRYNVRPSQIAGIMRQLQNVGMVIVASKQAGDMFREREYLRVSKFEAGAQRLLVVNIS